MPMHEKDKCDSYNGLTIVGLIALIFTSVYFILSSLAYSSLYHYEATTCNISNVSYPVELPTDETIGLWTTCDCGKHCQTRFPCVNIYDSETADMLKYDYTTRDYSCTITETSCPSGEDPLVLRQELEEAIAQAQTYVNSTIGCYKHSDEPGEHPVYLHVDFDQREEAFIASSAIFGTNLLWFVVVYITFKVKECRRKNETKTGSKIVLSGV